MALVMNKCAFLNTASVVTATIYIINNNSDIYLQASAYKYSPIQAPIVKSDGTSWTWFRSPAVRLLRKLGAGSE